MTNHAKYRTSNTYKPPLCQSKMWLKAHKKSLLKEKHKVGINHQHHSTYLHFHW